MSSELVQINQAAMVQKGGIGINTKSKFFQAKPATIQIVQNSSTVGVNRGFLRISETGHEFKEMWVTLLDEPFEGRQFYAGDPGDLNKTPENLLCFSNDLVYPDQRAKMPQSMNCASCSKGNWDAYNTAKKEGLSQQQLRPLIPQCEVYFKAMFIDTVFKMPLQMYIRSKAKASFMQGMELVTRAIIMAQDKNPNIFDFRFKLSTKLITTGKYSTYVPVISDVEYIGDNEELRKAFGDVYFQYINWKTRNVQQQEEATDTQHAIEDAETLESQLVEGEYVGDTIVV